MILLNFARSLNAISGFVRFYLINRLNLDFDGILPLGW